VRQFGNPWNFQFLGAKNVCFIVKKVSKCILLTIKWVVFDLPFVLPVKGLSDRIKRGQPLFSRLSTLTTIPSLFAKYWLAFGGDQS
jgi:hypothetical protein